MDMTNVATVLPACRRCPSGGAMSPLPPDGGSIAQGREDGQADKKNAEPVVSDPA